MTRRRLLQLLVVTLCYTPSVLGGAIITAQPAAAHHLGGFGPLFPANPTIRFTQGFPGGAFRDRVGISARAEWNFVMGGERPINAPGADIANFNPMAQCAPDANSITIHWIDTATTGHANALGVTNFCTIGNQRYDAHIWYDAVGRDWYTGVGDANDGLLNQCIPSCQDDFWSVASHEQGHAMAFDHFADGGAICSNNSLRHTMCPSIYGGTERQRDYEIHEEESFHIAY